MKIKIIALLFYTISIAVASGSVFAGQYNEQWSAQCLSDHRKEGQSEEILQKYCGCIIQEAGGKGEESYPTPTPEEEILCEDEAGWK